MCQLYFSKARKRKEKAMAPHSSTFAWKIPQTEEPGGLQSMGSLGVGHDWATSLSLFTFTFHFHALEKEMATHSNVLAWRIPGTGVPGGLPSMGSHRGGHDWSDLAAAAGKEKKPICFLSDIWQHRGKAESASDSLGRQRLFIIYTLRSSPAFLCNSVVGHGVGASLRTKHTQPSSEPERRNWQWRWFNKQGPPREPQTRPSIHWNPRYHR